jgi:hypothetical protein
MENKEEDIEFIKVSVYQLIDIINRANARIKAHKKVGSTFDIEQWEHLKKGYTIELLDLLKDFELPLQLLEA